MLALLTHQVCRQVVRIECDNTTAIAYVNRQGGIKSETLNLKALLLYTWALEH